MGTAESFVFDSDDPLPSRPWMTPPADELPGTVKIGKIIAESVDCILYLYSIRVYTTGVVIQFKYRLKDANRSHRYMANPERPFDADRNRQPIVGIRYTDGTKGSSLTAVSSVSSVDPRQYSGPPIVTSLGSSGSGSLWSVEYFVWPLRTTDAILLVEWPEYGLNNHELILSSEWIEKATRNLHKLKDMRAAAVAQGDPIRTDMSELAIIANELEDLGAVVEVARPKMSREPVVKISAGQGVVEIHELLEEDIATIIRYLQSATCYLIETDGLISIQVVGLGEDSALIARVMASWISRRGAENS